jgi:anthranilate phosphoribosyltransferase
MGRALADLGCERAILVSGRDGMDEMSTGAVNDLVEVTGGGVRTSAVDPAQLGFRPPKDGEIAGGDPAQNADVLREVLAGRPGAARDVVLLNAAAAIWLADAAPTLAGAVAVARDSIDGGAARERLDAFVAVTRRLGGA